MNHWSYFTLIKGYSDISSIENVFVCVLFPEYQANFYKSGQALERALKYVQMFEYKHE